MEWNSLSMIRYISVNVRESLCQITELKLYKHLFKYELPVDM